MSPVVINGRIRIPGTITDLASFCRWMHSDDCKGDEYEEARFSFLNGDIYVDLSATRDGPHARANEEFTTVLNTVLEETKRGQYLSDYFHERAFFSHPQAGFATEPDGVFISAASMRLDSVRLKKVSSWRFDVEGVPDMVLEIIHLDEVSCVAWYDSRKKDKEVLRDLYWRVGIPEYWLVDVTGGKPEFQILRHTSVGYEPSAAEARWLASAALGKSFMFTTEYGDDGEFKCNLSFR